MAKESLMEYGEEVLRLIATDQFVKRLPGPKQKKYVDLENPSSLDEGGSLALQYEPFEWDESSNTDGYMTKSRVSPVCVNDDKRPSVKEMAQIQQRINQVQQKVEMKSGRSGSGEGQQIAN